MVHEALKEYVKNKDIDSIRYIFIDSLDVDPTFEEYKDDEIYCKAEGINLFIEHKDLNKFEYDSSRWNENYWFMLKKDLMENFSEKRFSHIKEVAKVIYADKIKRLNAEREERKKIHIEEEQNKEKRKEIHEEEQNKEKIKNNKPKNLEVTTKTVRSYSIPQDNQDNIHIQQKPDRKSNEPKKDKGIAVIIFLIILLIIVILIMH